MTIADRRLAAAAAATGLALLLALPAAAQEQEPTTISAIERGDAQGEVLLVGATLEQTDDDEEYFFSDGTGTIKLDIDTSTASVPVPLYELIGVTGTVASDEVDVSSWELLPIMTPAVIVPEEDVIGAFQGWIVAYGSQEPVE